MFDRIHHAGIAIADLVSAKSVFADGLGLRVDETRSPLPEGSKQRGPDPTDILDIPIGNTELEMNAPPIDGTTPRRNTPFHRATRWSRRSPSHLPAFHQRAR